MTTTSSIKSSTYIEACHGHIKPRSGSLMELVIKEYHGQWQHSSAHKSSVDQEHRMSGNFTLILGELMRGVGIVMGGGWLLVTSWVGVVIMGTNPFSHRSPNLSGSGTMPWGIVVSKSRWLNINLQCSISISISEKIAWALYQIGNGCFSC